MAKSGPPESEVTRKMLEGYTTALITNDELHRAWIKLSQQLGGLSDKFVMVEVQQSGKLDIIIRCIDITPCDYSNPSLVDKFSFSFMLSRMWLLNTYEFIRIYDSRINKDQEVTNKYLKDLKRIYDCFRVPAAKHQVARDGELKGRKIKLASEDNPSDICQYDGKEQKLYNPAIKYDPSTGSTVYVGIIIHDDGCIEQIEMSRLQLAGLTLRLADLTEEEKNEGILTLAAER